MKKSYVLLFIPLLLAFSCSKEKNEQQKSFEQEIVKFEEQDKLTPPKEGAILFIGSSSIRLWHDLSGRLTEYDIIRRGFGGSGISDLSRYADRIIFPYHPSLIFVYSGENDIANGKNLDAVFKDFDHFHSLIYAHLPETSVVFISLKPSPARKHLMPDFYELNNKIKNFIVRQPGKYWGYLDIYSLMLDGDGLPEGSLFSQDQLHMNSKGYDIWEEAIRKYLEEKGPDLHSK